MNNKTLAFAFKKSVPILFGYLFLGCAFGISLVQIGYSFWWAFFISLVTYSGSMQFMLVSLLAQKASLSLAALMTLFVNGRHIFYGLSFIDKFKAMGKKYLYMVFSLTDETYSVLSSSYFPEGVDEKKASFLIALFDHLYWIAGGVIGALAGTLIPFDFEGIGFSMTALFTVIMVDGWRKKENRFSQCTGIVSAIFMLIIFGADKFILPALLTNVLVLLLARRKIELKETAGRVN